MVSEDRSALRRAKALSKLTIASSYDAVARYVYSPVYSLERACLSAIHVGFFAREESMKRFLVVLFVVSCLVLPTSSLAEDGTAGLAFLKLGVGARAIAMGDAYTAVGGDAMSMYWNPAGTVSVDGIDVGLMHAEWFQDIRYEFVGAAKSDGSQGFGLSVVGLYMDDLERREGPTSEPIGHFGVFDFAFTGNYSRRLTESFDVGCSVKYLHQKIDTEVADGVAADLGAIYRFPMVTGLSAGVSVQNLGPQMSFIEEKFDLPVLFRVGAAYGTPVPALNGDLLLSSDAVVPGDGDTKAHFGIEFEYAKMFALRAGYRTGWDNQDISVGFGAKVRGVRIDYAYVPFYSDLGDTHRVSLGFAL